MAAEPGGPCFRICPTGMSRFSNHFHLSFFEPVVRKGYFVRAGCYFNANPNPRFNIYLRYGLENIFQKFFLELNIVRRENSEAG